MSEPQYGFTLTLPPLVQTEIDRYVGRLWWRGRDGDRYGRWSRSSRLPRVPHRSHDPRCSLTVCSDRSRRVVDGCV